MLTEKRKKEILNAANKYSDTAIKVSTVAAARDFYNDYCDGKWSFDEHVVIMCLTQKYIDNKCGAITREACLQEQKKLIRWLASGGNDEKNCKDESRSMEESI